jgi:threonine synthase
MNPSPIKYYSTNKQSPIATFREATIKGQAPDRGLYFPDSIPVLDAAFIRDLPNLSKAEIAYHVIRPYVAGEIPDAELQRICAETVAFDFPLQKSNDRISSLELFHGPTLAFKDVGARFMSRCLGYFSKEQDKKITVLVATSGDTGSAVANGFLGVEGVDVVILYPSGKVSKVQELQLTTLGQNITALEVSGTFDDCQAMVKQAFADTELTERMFLTSANSINVARWLPQQFYYFYAMQQWQGEQPPVICVPSGNFGNVCAGLLAYVSGLPASHFVVACNENDVFSEYLRSASFTPKTAVPTISNAMDVGNPSNFVRILELFKHDHARIKALISSYSINDKVTAETIADVYKKYHYLLDPHGAVAYSSLAMYLNGSVDQKGFILETAHPVKFADVVEKITGEEIAIPESIRGLLSLQKKSSLIQPEYSALKEYLTERS